ncbi:hypothetical protein OAG29_01030, partial [Planctomycetaceae bacterium]|nr:hypothetical protein [Planctomycetaceae bacterium]
NYDEIEHRERLGLNEPNYVELEGQSRTRQENFQVMMQKYGVTDTNGNLIEESEEPPREAPPFPNF